MLRAIQIIQELPWPTRNSTSCGRKLIIKDTESGREYDVPFEKGNLTAKFGGYMFDYYGRNIEIDESIRYVIEKAGRWQPYNTDVEAFLVEKKDGKWCIAYLHYYEELKDGRRSPVVRYTSELNPSFRKEEIKVELLCSSIEIVDKEFFPSNSAIQRIYGGSEGKIWLAKINEHYCFLRPGDNGRICCCTHYEKNVTSDTCGSGEFFENVEWRGGNLVAKVRDKKQREYLIVTNDTFIEEYNKSKKMFDFEMPFYLAQQQTIQNEA